ncbi:MAG: T9SS type A sorting domain-containing protein, partial [Flavobacteriales bacterium]
NYVTLEEAEGCFTIAVDNLPTASESLVWDATHQLLRYTGNLDWQACTVFNMYGAAVLSMSGSHMQEWSCSDLVSGVYLVHAIVNGRSERLRIFVP